MPGLPPPRNPPVSFPFFSLLQLGCQTKLRTPVQLESGTHSQYCVRVKCLPETPLSLNPGSLALRLSIPGMLGRARQLTGESHPPGLLLSLPCWLILPAIPLPHFWAQMHIPQDEASKNPFLLPGPPLLLPSPLWSLPGGWGQDSPQTSTTIGVNLPSKPSALKHLSTFVKTAATIINPIVQMD